MRLYFNWQLDNGECDETPKEITETTEKLETTSYALDPWPTALTMAYIFNAEYVSIV